MNSSSPSPSPSPQQWHKRAGASLLRELTRPWAPARGDTVVVAVSGGADSVALLHLLCSLAPGRGWKLVAASLDHGLRGEAGAEDSRFVAALADHLGLPIQLERREVSPRPGHSTEQAARTIRHQFLREVAAHHNARAIALGHTLDDQAETVLYRLGRGTGLAGLGAMARFSDCLWRPLLSVRRTRLRELLDEASLPWREDDSNQSMDPVRNRIRAELMPALERVLGPASAEALARVAILSREDEQLLEELSRDRGPNLPETTPDGQLRIPRSSLMHLPSPLLRRILRRAVVTVSGGRVRPSSRHLLAMEALVRAESHGTEVHLPGGVVVRRRDGGISFVTDLPEESN